MRAIALAVLLPALALGLAACGGYGGGGSSSTSTAGSGKTVVELDDYYFKPKTLTGDPGKKVTLELKNEGKVEHNFTLDEQSVNKDVAPGDEAEVTVTIPKSGALTFYCKYHRSKGMTGSLEATSSGY